MTQIWDWYQLEGLVEQEALQEPVKELGEDFEKWEQELALRWHSQDHQVTHQGRDQYYNEVTI